MSASIISATIDPRSGSNAVQCQTFNDSKNCVLVRSHPLPFTDGTLLFCKVVCPAVVEHKKQSPSSALCLLFSMTSKGDLFVSTVDHESLDISHSIKVADAEQVAPPASYSSSSSFPIPFSKPMSFFIQQSTTCPVADCTSTSSRLLLFDSCVLFNTAIVFVRFGLHINDDSSIAIATGISPSPFHLPVSVKHHVAPSSSEVISITRDMFDADDVVVIRTDSKSNAHTQKIIGLRLMTRKGIDDDDDDVTRSLPRCVVKFLLSVADSRFCSFHQRILALSRSSSSRRNSFAAGLSSSTSTSISFGTPVAADASLRHRSSSLRHQTKNVIVVLSDAFLLSIYDETKLIGTIPLPLRYRNSSSPHFSSSLKRRSDSRGSTMKPVLFRSFSSSSAVDVDDCEDDDTSMLNDHYSSVCVVVVYEDFASCTVARFSLRLRPETSSSGSYYVDCTDLFNVCLLSPPVLSQLVQTNFVDSLHSTTRSTSFHEFQEQLYSFLHDGVRFSLVSDDGRRRRCAKEQLLVEIRGLPNETTASFQLFDMSNLGGRNCANRDDHEFNNNVVIPSHFLLLQKNSDHYSHPHHYPLEPFSLLLHTQNEIWKSNNFSLFEQRFDIGDRSQPTKQERNHYNDDDDEQKQKQQRGPLLLTFHKELCEVSCWSKQIVENTNKNQNGGGGRFQQIEQSVELARLALFWQKQKKEADDEGADDGDENNISSNKKKKMVINRVLPLSFNKSHSTAVPSITTETSVFENERNKVKSTCFIVEGAFDENSATSEDPSKSPSCRHDDTFCYFAVVLVYHCELGAQLLILTTTTTSAASSIVDLSTFENRIRMDHTCLQDATKLHPFVVVDDAREQE